MLGSLGLVASVTAEAQEILRFASPCPRGQDVCSDHRWISSFAEHIAPTGFAIDTHPHADGESAEAMIRKVVDGDVDLATIDSTPFGEIEPLFYGFMAPFAFDSFGHLYRVLRDPAIIRAMTAIGENRGFRVLSAIPIGGFSGIFNARRSVRSLDDLRTLRIRARDRLELGMLRDWYTPSVIMAWSDVRRAIERDMIDGYIEPPVVALSFGHPGMIQYFTDARIQAPVRFLIANQHWYEGLVPSQRATVDTAIASADRDVMNWASEETEKALAMLVREGIVVSRLDAKARESLRRLSQTVFTYLLHPDDAAVFVDSVERNRR